MTSRERVLATLNFRTPDRMPKDLGGMGSTGISVFAYPALVAALGLPARRPKIGDGVQMLAVPDRDVLDALDCDIVCAGTDSTNAFEEPEKWKPYDFNGRLPALVSNPEAYRVEPDGTIVMNGDRFMPPAAHVFNAVHAGQPLDLEAEMPHEDLQKIRNDLAANVIRAERVKEIAAYCRRVRESTDRAIMFGGLCYGLGFPHGMAAWSMLCLTDPDYVKEYFAIVTAHAIENVKRLLPAIHPFIDVLMAAADDQGTQNATILPPDVFRDLYLPFYRQANDAVHAIAPQVKTFLHSCGAIYAILDHIINAGFDVLNPVQWSAGGHSCREWKDVCRGRIALWGGGVNTQATLPLGTVADVERETAAAASCLAEGNGYVFCAIHNLLAEIPAEKIIAMYRAAGRVRRK